MTLDGDAIALLAAWIKGTDIGLLELHGPDVALCLVNENGDITRLPDALPPGSVAGPTVVVAQSVGVFIDRHPLDLEPVVETGDDVREGEPLGLLRIGTLLLPVRAPCDGIVGQRLAEHGTTVGYGTPLLALHPDTSEAMP
jgi:acetyl-CoA carboxylase biotin carboxyl carrier protein